MSNTTPQMWADDTAFDTRETSGGAVKIWATWTENGRQQAITFRPMLDGDVRCEKRAGMQVCLRPQGHDGLHSGLGNYADLKHIIDVPANALVGERRYLMAWFGYDPVTQTHIQRIVREFSDTEDKSLRYATQCLREVTEQSGYQALIEARDRIALVLSDLRKIPATVPNQRAAAVRGLHEAFKSWLSAIRTFDDQTSHFVDGASLDGPSMLKEFKSALSEEYDNNLAYRLCMALRNLTQHSGPVINSIHFQSSELPNGRVLNEVMVGLHGPTLVTASPKLKKGIRDELSCFSQSLDIESIVNAVMASCERAFARLAVLMSNFIDGWARTVEAINNEATTGGAKAALVMGVMVPSGVPGRSTAGAYWVDCRFASTARRALTQANEVLTRPRFVVTARDLT